MSKKPDSNPSLGFFGLSTGGTADQWQSQITSVARRFNQEYQGEPFELPEEVENMPIFRDRISGTLQQKLTSPFWELAKPQKNQYCLDIGCGVSFLIYPWREWNALFHGQEISSVARDGLNSRSPQLNSKLFKGVELAPAHQLQYETGKFDLAIATGFSCYYPQEYWLEVMAEVKRVLKPQGILVFDILNGELPLAEDWAILETYLGTEVYLESLENWESLIKKAGAKILKKQSGELWEMYRVRF
ncbi:Methyltransferase type 11 [Limnospira maxima CS-328]|uniref:Methyltransferase type 11 n=1 Tax=Limnospira maxima CS-328 TaxID=513049 RepID=B5VZ49_LIMMA|nr:class I SAM-dependent methyltransferase [Limnospira maxima]EDZ95521.1 Methyltransferase type 11 [Limnospira maxima CS-328]MDC0840619.1 class I SAM-dependent methyltransferase [Limnoraphis robusta]